MRACRRMPAATAQVLCQRCAGGIGVPVQQRWQREETVHGFLVGLDISGFSRREAPDGLLAARDDLLQAIGHTVVFHQATDLGAVEVQFLGDELRLAFHRDVGAGSVRNFVDQVFSALERMNRRVLPEFPTEVRGAVLAGPITWRVWQGCGYLDGPIPYRYDAWLRFLHPGEVVINMEFRDALQSEGAPVAGLISRPLGADTGYVLRSGSNP